MVHLVYCDNVGKSEERVLAKIQSGKKTMIVRGAAGRKIPHSRVEPGESLYFIEKGTTDIYVKATVKNVLNYVKLSDEEITQVLEKNQKQLQLSDKQKLRWHKKCLCLVEFEDIQQIPTLSFEHQGNMDDWLILEKIDDVLVGTSIPYDYKNARFK